MGQQIDWREVARVALHPLSLAVLESLAERPGSPREVADQLGRTAKSLVYHFGRLEELELIELVPGAGAGTMATYRLRA